MRCVHGRANSRGDGGPDHPIGGEAAWSPVVGFHGDLAGAHRPAVRPAVPDPGRGRSRATVRAGARPALPRELVLIAVGAAVRGRLPQR
ncbi:hypothetical protein ACFYPZ_01085 [Streptomyces sp. NPDC005506]|uniref:hypothetical protein n=1 Tax=unclassified Streptomyces TaxID=2593676 RepID=UPI0036A337E5